jgi:hypothetical protein
MCWTCADVAGATSTIGTPATFAIASWATAGILSADGAGDLVLTAPTFAASSTTTLNCASGATVSGAVTLGTSATFTTANCKVKSGLTLSVGGATTSIWQAGTFGVADDGILNVIGGISITTGTFQGVATQGVGRYNFERAIIYSAVSLSGITSTIYGPTGGLGVTFQLSTPGMTIPSLSVSGGAVQTTGGFPLTITNLTVTNTPAFTIGSPNGQLIVGMGSTLAGTLTGPSSSGTTTFSVTGGQEATVQTSFSVSSSFAMQVTGAASTLYCNGACTFGLGVTVKGPLLISGTGSVAFDQCTLESGSGSITTASISAYFLCHFHFRTHTHHNATGTFAERCGLHLRILPSTPAARAADTHKCSIATLYALNSVLHRRLI